MEARYYTREEKGVQCRLCPHCCIIGEGKSGICKVRVNRSGRLISESYGRLTALHLDPIEKKPLYHFYPGRSILSAGSAGCNMHCSCCQNWQISQIDAVLHTPGKRYSPEALAEQAGSLQDNIGIAYTYNEPAVWFEFMLDTANLIRGAGLKNVVVSNGYINEEPLLELLQVADAFNIDLKAFNDSFYKKITGARLDPVLQTLRTISAQGAHLEITCLVIPSQNDDEGEMEKMSSWISRELGRETVLHLSRYHPAYRMDLEATPSKKMQKLHSIASEQLDYVYVGNIHLKGLQDTKCSRCGNTVIYRNGYLVDSSKLTPEGHCSYCGNRIVRSMDTS